MPSSRERSGGGRFVRQRLEVNSSAMLPRRDVVLSIKVCGGAPSHWTHQRPAVVPALRRHERSDDASREECTTGSAHFILRVRDLRLRVSLRVPVFEQIPTNWGWSLACAPRDEHISSHRTSNPVFGLPLRNCTQVDRPSGVQLHLVVLQMTYRGDVLLYGLHKRLVCSPLSPHTCAMWKTASEKESANSRFSINRKTPHTITHTSALEL